MRCDEVTALLPGTRRRRAGRFRGRTPRRHVPAVPGRARALPPPAAHAVDAADPVRRARRPGLLGETLAAITDAAEHGARRTLAVGPPPRVRRCDRWQRARRGRDRRGADRPLPQTRPRSASPAERRQLPRRAPRAAEEPAAILARLAPTARRAVAQLVEHRSPKPAVGGSSPSCPARTSELRAVHASRRHEPTDQATDGASGIRSAARARAAVARRTRRSSAPGRSSTSARYAAR